MSSSDALRQEARAQPIEIIIQILSYTDAYTVGLFRACSRNSMKTVDDASDIIYEAIALKQFNAFKPCSAPDSGISIDTVACDPALDALHSENQVAPVQKALEKAIRCQRTASTAYDNVKTWRDFVMRRTLVDHAWRSGRPSKRAIFAFQVEEEGIGQMGVWRFKICPISRILIASTPVIVEGQGALASVELQPLTEAQQAYHKPLSLTTQGYTHVEYSNGHLVFVDNHRVNIYENDLSPERRGFTHKHTIAPPTDLMSYKARYPYMVALSRASSTVYLFNIQDGVLAQQYTLPGMLDRSYVELDQWSLFLADERLLVVNQKTEQVYTLLDVDDEELEPDAFQSTRFTAVHHSLDGRHLVVGGDMGEVIWIRDYRNLLCAEGSVIETVKRSESIVILRLPLEDEAEIDNICVENNRVVFTARAFSFPVMYLFELSDWEDCSEFAANPPTVRVLTSGVPTGHNGITRLEMDSTSIYFTASTHPEFASMPHFSDVHPADLALSWIKLDGTKICKAEVKPVFHLTADTPKPLMHEVALGHGIGANNAVLCYDFSILEDEETQEPQYEQGHA